MGQVGLDKWFCGGGGLDKALCGGRGKAGSDKFGSVGRRD